MFKAKSIDGIITAIQTMANDLVKLADAKDFERDTVSVQVDALIDKKQALTTEIARANRIADKLAKVIE